MDPQVTTQSPTQATLPTSSAPTNPTAPTSSSKSLFSKNLVILTLVFIIILMAGGFIFVSYKFQKTPSIESVSQKGPSPTVTATQTTQTNTTVTPSNSNNVPAGQSKLIGTAGKPVVLANSSFNLSITASDLHMHVTPTQPEIGALQYAYKDDYKNIQLAAIKITLTNNSENVLIESQSDLTAMPSTGSEEVVFDSTALGEANNLPKTYALQPHQTISGYIYYILPITDNNTILLYKPFAENDSTKPVIEIQM